MKMRFSAAACLAAAAAAFMAGTSASPVAELSPLVVPVEVQPAAAAADSLPVALRDDMACQGFDIWVLSFEVCTAGTNYRKFSFQGKAVGLTLAKANCDLDVNDKCQTKFWVPAGTTVLNWYCKNSKLAISGEYYPVWQTVKIPEVVTPFNC